MGLPGQAFRFGNVSVQEAVFCSRVSYNFKVAADFVAVVIHRSSLHPAPVLSADGTEVTLNDPIGVPPLPQGAGTEVVYGNKHLGVLIDDSLTFKPLLKKLKCVNTSL